MPRVFAERKVDDFKARFRQIFPQQVGARHGLQHKDASVADADFALGENLRDGFSAHSGDDRADVYKRQGLYVLMQLLMLLPVVGLVVHIICLVAAKQRSFKNYCRAVVILGIIGLLLVIAGVIVGYVMLDSVNEFLADFNIRIEPLF